VFAVKAANAGDLARAVEAFFSKSEAERRAIGAAGREWAAANRSWTHTVKAIETAYESLL
jgi:glycosyltransferase involved in cell wall biosynthesis